MKHIVLTALIVLTLAACSSTGTGGSSQMYGEIGGGVGYTSH